MDHKHEAPQDKSKSSQLNQTQGLRLGPKNSLNDAGVSDQDCTLWLDKISLESLVEIKISRFFDQLDSHYPDDLYSLIIEKVEKTLLHQILRRTGYNQAQASKILGINRNTLRKKMKYFGLG